MRGRDHVRLKDHRGSRIFLYLILRVFFALYILDKHLVTLGPGSNGAGLASGKQTVCDLCSALLAALLGRDAKLHQAHQLGAYLVITFFGAVNDEVFVLQNFLQIFRDIMRGEPVIDVLLIKPLCKGTSQIGV